VVNRHKTQEDNAIALAMSNTIADDAMATRNRDAIYLTGLHFQTSLYQPLLMIKQRHAEPITQIIKGRRLRGRQGALILIGDNREGKIIRAATLHLDADHFTKAFRRMITRHNNKSS
jgi:hypothetical protein